MDRIQTSRYDETLLAVDELADNLARTAAMHDAQASLPPSVFDQLHQAGLLGLTIGAEHGGSGASLATAAMVVSRIGQGDPAVGLILTMHYIYQTTLGRSGNWSERVRKLVGESAVRAGAMINALRVEPELGTPARGGLPETTAYRTSTGWRLRGQKIYSTGGNLLHWGMVWARTDEDEPRVGYFLVPLRAPGVSLRESWNHIGMRATLSHTFVFNDVALEADYAGDIRSPEEWKQPDPLQIVWNNILISALYNGIAQAARNWLVEFLKTRTPSNLGKSLASMPRFQEMVGEIDALLFANRTVLAAIADLDCGKGDTLAPHALESGLVKYLVTSNAIRAVEIGLAGIGNPALSKSNPIERFYRDVLCSRVHVPQNDMILCGAGRAALAEAS